MWPWVRAASARWIDPNPSPAPATWVSPTSTGGISAVYSKSNTVPSMPS